MTWERWLLFGGFFLSALAAIAFGLLFEPYVRVLL